MFTLGQGALSSADAFSSLYGAPSSIPFNPCDLNPEMGHLSWSLSTHRFEVAPCPEPCSGVQKSKALWLSSHHQKEVEGTKAKPKPLLMPINTFSGIVQ